MALMFPNSESRKSSVRGIFQQQGKLDRSYNRFLWPQIVPRSNVFLNTVFQSRLLTWFPAERDEKLIRAYHSVFKITWIVDFWRCYEESFNHVIDIMEIFSSCFLCWMAGERVDCETVNRKIEYCRITEYV